MPDKKNSRTITASLPQKIKGSITSHTFKNGMGVFVAIFLISFTGTLGVLLFNTFEDYRTELAAQAQVREQLSYWESVIVQYPHFPAAYYEAAVYAARLSEAEKAKEYIAKALFVDPNFFEAEALAKELESEN